MKKEHTHVLTDYSNYDILLLYFNIFICDERNDIMPHVRSPDLAIRLSHISIS